MTRIGIETRPVNSPMFALESMFPRALPINRSSTRQPKRPRRGDTRSYVEGQGEYRANELFSPKVRIFFDEGALRGPIVGGPRKLLS